MEKKLLDALTDKMEELEWWCRIYDDCIEIGKYSPAGEDFFFTVTDKENLAEEVQEYATDFDADEHAEMWVESRGKRGVPDSIRTLIDDADAIQEMLDELAAALTEVRNQFRKGEKE
jgi:hypothetical protein